MPVFVDSNVLVYCRDSSDAEKQSRAQAWMAHLWRSRDGRLSTQVLHEFYVAATRKLRPCLSLEDARADVRALLAWRPLPLDGSLSVQAWEVQDAYGLSYWDALIVASALRASCGTLLTADLQDGQDLGGVKVTNPFQNLPGGAL